MLVFAGSTHIDESARLQDALHPGESNRARWSVHLGGVAANAVRAAQTHCATLLISILGEDSAGKSIARYFTQAGTNCDFIMHDTMQSGRYTAVLDQQGELVLGLADTEITESIQATHIQQALEKQPSVASILAFDANLSSRCIADLCQCKPVPQLAALGVSPVKNMRLKDQGSQIDYLFVNRPEAAMLTGLPASTRLTSLSEALQQMQFVCHVISDGAHSLVVADTQRSNLYDVPPARVHADVSVNGAGDALAGATLAALSQGADLHTSVEKFGLSAAAAVINQEQLAPALNSYA